MHIIAKQTFRFRLRNAKGGPDVQSGIARLCNEELPARLNTLFDSISGPQTLIRVPKLDISLSIDTHEPLPADLGKRLTAEIGQALLAAMQEAAPGLDRRQTQLDAIFFYLEHGSSPWWADSVMDKGPAAAVRELDERGLLMLRDRASRLLAASPSPRYRFIQLLAAADIPGPLLQHWAALSPETAADIIRLLLSLADENSIGPASARSMLTGILLQPLVEADIRPLPLPAKLEAILGAAFRSGLPIDPRRAQELYRDPRRLSQESSGPGELLATICRRLLETGTGDMPAAEMPPRQDNRPAAAQPADQPEPGKQEDTVPAEHRIRIGNAGLVLIAPYLGAFFKTTGLVQDHVLADPARAIALLRCCAFADTACLEQELVLEKLLCGLTPAESPGPLPLLTATETEECEALLTAVIANWSVLKQTSPEGLRQAFLQREGILRHNDSGWQLKVQRQPHDILLDFLPWSYSILKLPWMQDMMFVDWTK